jgi:hypothetical protein
MKNEKAGRFNYLETELLSRCSILFLFNLQLVNATTFQFLTHSSTVLGKRTKHIVDLQMLKISSGNDLK